MKIPKTIRANGYDISIAEVKTDKYQGQYDNKKKHIDIAAGYTDASKAASLLHELLHVGFATTELYRVIAHADEEVIVTNLETFLFGVLRDNPKLVEYIQKS